MTDLGIYHITIPPGIYPLINSVILAKIIDRITKSYNEDTGFETLTPIIVVGVDSKFESGYPVNFTFLCNDYIQFCYD